MVKPVLAVVPAILLLSTGLAQAAPAHGAAGWRAIQTLDVNGTRLVRTLSAVQPGQTAIYMRAKLHMIEGDHHLAFVQSSRGWIRSTAFGGAATQTSAPIAKLIDAGKITAAPHGVATGVETVAVPEHVVGGRLRIRLFLDTAGLDPTDSVPHLRKVSIQRDATLLPGSVMKPAVVSMPVRGVDPKGRPVTGTYTVTVWRGRVTAANAR